MRKLNKQGVEHQLYIFLLMINIIFSFNKLLFPNLLMEFDHSFKIHVLKNHVLIGI